KTPADRKTACTCLKSAANTIKGINAGKAAGLPAACGVNIPYKISPSTDCSKVSLSIFHQSRLINRIFEALVEPCNENLHAHVNATVSTDNQRRTATMLAPIDHNHPLYLAPSD
ncbi:tyrosine protein phosphatase, partial [Datura stramonium]|nr:tyrosine protein phosphatase [Datura stramonium]